MNVDEAIYGRRSVREYKSEAITEATIKTLIDAAIHAPSAINAQPWSFVVIRDRQMLDRTSTRAKEYMLTTESDSTPHHLRASLADPDFQIFHDAPALIVIAATAQGPWIVEDCALAAQNLMLCAFAHGLGSCWIGFAQRWLNTADGKAELGIGEQMVPIAPIIIGRPKEFPSPVSREAPRVRWIG